MLLFGTAAADPPIVEVSQLRFYSSFWQNLHHFLYVSAWAGRPILPRAPRLAMPLPQEPTVSLTADDQAAWNEVVTYYDRNIASKDLLFDGDLTRIKVALGDADDQLSNVWSGTEMLFHEASHALFHSIRTAINSAASTANKEPRDLWHVVLFYIVGDVTRQELAKRGVEYRPYLYATGLFDRAWPAFREPIERHVRPFVDRRVTLDRMATELAQALPR